MAIERPRVFHVVDSLGIGGAELGLVRLVEGTRDQFDHAVLCIREGGETARRLETQGVPIMILGKAPGRQWNLPLRIARVCRRIRPHVVHTRNWGTMDAIIGARLARVPVLIHAEHGFSVDDVTGPSQRRRWVRRVLSVAIDRVVAVSAHLRELLITEVGMAPEQVVLIRDGIDAQQFQAHADRATVRARLGYAASEFIIGSVGRLDPVKNFPALIDAMLAVTARLPNARLLLAGDGPEEERLRQHVRQRGLSGSVRLLGYRSDIPALLNAMDVFALPSLAEGTCNAILEAMAVGLPVIATGVAGNPELVLDGQTGALVAPRDVVALADRIQFYANNSELCRQHGQAGREHVLRHYTAEHMVGSYADLYRQELARREGAAQRAPAPAANGVQP